MDVKKLAIVGIAIVAITVALFYFLQNRKQPHPKPHPKPTTNLDSFLSQEAIKRFRTTGGAGICPSLSEYYDPILGYCVERPKMVMGAQYGGGRCFFDSDCIGCGSGTEHGVCDRFGECQCSAGFGKFF